MSKIIISQTFDNNTLSRLIELVKQRNVASKEKNVAKVQNLQDQILFLFKPFDLSGNKNIKLQRIKESLIAGYISDKRKAEETSISPLTSSIDIPGNSIKEFARQLVSYAASLTSSPSEIQSIILLKLQSEHNDILNNPTLKEELFDELKDKFNINLYIPTTSESSRITIVPSTAPGEKDKILEFIKEANQYAKNGDLNQVQRVQFEVEKIFNNQYDIFEKDKSGNYLNPKLRLLYDRTLQHFKKLKDYANKVKSRGKDNKGYVFPAEYRNPDFDFDKATVALAKDLIAKAKSEIKNPDHKKDLRNRIEWLIQTGHDKILDNPILKNKLYETIKNETSIDLNKPVTASLKKLNKIIIAFEKNNFIKEAEILDKIFDKLTK